MQVEAVQVQSVPLPTALSKRAVGETGEGGKHWDTYTLRRRNESPIALGPRHRWASLIYYYIKKAGNA